MIIHRIHASGFQIIGDPIDLDFPEEGRIGILGTNESGKTTLLEAIEYALYGLKRGHATEEARENIITWGKEEAIVEVEFTSGQDRFLLSRTFNSRGGHKARLVPIVDGHKNTHDALTSLTEIESKVEQITGMDRESFTKLVYIKQKDLDALKRAGMDKTKREQLVDKVMGIELFDDAAKHVKDDSSQATDEIDKKAAELTPVRKNAKSYQEKLAARDALRKEVVHLETQLNQQKEALQAEKSTLGAYDWLFAFNSKNELVTSKRQERDRIQLDINRIVQLKQDKARYEAAVNAYKPEVSRLETIREKIVRLEDNLGQSHAALDRLNTMHKEAILRANLNHRELELAGHDLQERKERQLIQFVLMLVLSVALIVAGALTQPLLSILGILPVALAVVLYMRYRRTDRILSHAADIQALNRQIGDSTRRVQDAHHQIERLTRECGFRNHQDVDLALSKTNEQIMQMSGQPSIHGVEALAQSAQADLKRLDESDPDKSFGELDREIIEKLGEIRELEKTKPPLAETLQHDAALHREYQTRVEQLQTKIGGLEKDCSGKLGTLTQLETDLETLRKDYDRLPGLEKDYNAFQEKKAVLDLVLQELGETSKKLRSQVMPHARMIINQILPILTDGRYSEFEIMEDLKFKAHSNEAGGYKEREVFSGGTQDQFLIVFRLAFTQSILDSRVMADRYSLLMDECISSSDDQRKQGIFEVLDAVKKTFSQIFVIAHEDISNLTDHHLVLARSRRGYTEIRSKSW
jgi:exonuclease SbcC